MAFFQFDIDFFKNNADGIAQTTITDYAVKLKTLNTLFVEKKIKFLWRWTSIISAITKKYPNANTRVNFYSAIMKYLVVKKKTKLRLYQNLAKEIPKLNSQWQTAPKVEKENVKTLKNDYESKRDAFVKKISGITIKKDLIVALFLLFPRRNDYLNIKYVKTTAATEDKSHNYMLVNETGYFLIFNQYKTQKYYGTQKFKITKSIIKKIIDLIIIQSEVGELIYDKSRQSFFTLLKKTTTRVFGKPIAINDIRKLHSTTKFGSILEKLLELENDSAQMGHSSSTKLKYYIF
tara:strand:+ start:1434 stop:2306 length:873 start_codon:yes stop_codon:yes gene_type:complete